MKTKAKTTKNKGKLALKIIGVILLVIAVLVGAAALLNYISTNANIKKASPLKG